MFYISYTYTPNFLYSFEEHVRISHSTVEQESFLCDNTPNILKVKIFSLFNDKINIYNKINLRKSAAITYCINTMHYKIRLILEISYAYI